MQNWEDTLIDYLEDQLSTQQRLEVEKALKNSKKLRDQLESLKLVLEGLEVLPEFQPSDRLHSNFYQYMKKFQTEEPSTEQDAKVISFWSKYRMAIQSAAAVVLLALGIFIGLNASKGKQLSQMEMELQEMKLAMMTLMQKESVSERIKAVNISYDLPDADNDIIEAMIHRMNRDESSNVRLSAVEALSRWADNPKVRDALINALSGQKDPVIQITLINILVELKEQRAIPPLEQLIDDTETMSSVKGEAQMGIFKITSI